MGAKVKAISTIWFCIALIGATSLLFGLVANGYSLTGRITNYKSKNNLHQYALPPVSNSDNIIDTMNLLMSKGASDFLAHIQSIGTKLSRAADFVFVHRSEVQLSSILILSILYLDSRLSAATTANKNEKDASHIIEDSFADALHLNSSMDVQADLLQQVALENELVALEAEIERQSCELKALNETLESVVLTLANYTQPQQPKLGSWLPPARMSQQAVTAPVAGKVTGTVTATAAETLQQPSSGIEYPVTVAQVNNASGLPQSPSAQAGTGERRLSQQDINRRRAGRLAVTLSSRADVTRLTPQQVQRLGKQQLQQALKLVGAPVAGAQTKAELLEVLAKALYSAAKTQE